MKNIKNSHTAQLGHSLSFLQKNEEEICLKYNRKFRLNMRKKLPNQIMTFFLNTLKAEKTTTI